MLSGEESLEASLVRSTAQPVGARKASPAGDFVRKGGPGTLDKPARGGKKARRPCLRVRRVRRGISEDAEVPFDEGIVYGTVHPPRQPPAKSGVQVPCSQPLM